MTATAMTAEEYASVRKEDGRKCIIVWGNGKSNTRNLVSFHGRKGFRFSGEFWPIEEFITGPQNLYLKPRP